MRWIATTSLICLCLARQPASAQESSASGWFGVGVFGGEPASTVDVGIDVESDSYALGLGARLRYLPSGVRGEDWDQASEVARLVRYFNYVTPTSDAPSNSLSLAVGELGGVSLGHGAIVDGYASGLDIDHGHVGAQARARWGDVSSEFLIDDIVAPRIAGARLAAALGPMHLGVSGVIDMSAPTVATTMSVATVAIPMGALDIEFRSRRRASGLGGSIYTDGVVLRTGVGLHLGISGELDRSAVRLRVRLEARAGTRGYVPSWIGPLYERRRADRYDVARAGGLGGLGGVGEVALEFPRGLAATVSYASRAGLPRLVQARLAAPYGSGFQVAMWAAAELGQGRADGIEAARGLALEARVTLPRNLFALGEVARMYRRIDEDAMSRFDRFWIATVALGAVVGE